MYIYMHVYIYIYIYIRTCVLAVSHGRVCEGFVNSLVRTCLSDILVECTFNS